MQAVAIKEQEQTTQANAPWHVLLATWLGGVFDGMDSSIFAMVLFPALSELLGTKSHAEVGQHGGYIIAMFMVGWAFGAMGFGILSDYIGRVKTLVATILLYSIFTGLCATSTEWWHLGIFRFLVGAGIGGEMGTGAVMLSECWPKKSRVIAVSAMATSLGFGYLLTALLNLWLGGLGWRWLFVVGVVPAILTIFIRMRLKESQHFTEISEQRKKSKGKDRSQLTAAEADVLRFTFKDLFNAENRYKTVIASVLTGVAIITWWAVVAWIPAWVNQLTGTLAVGERSNAMFLKDFGMICSGLFGGYIIKKIGYKWSMGGSFVLALATAVGMFMTVHGFGWQLLAWVVAVGFFAHMPFVCLWSYIPSLFEARIRGTAFGFSYNVGRFVAAGAALLSGELIKIFGGSYAMAASCVASVYVIGAIAAIFMPPATPQDSDLVH